MLIISSYLDSQAYQYCIMFMFVFLKHWASFWLQIDTRSVNNFKTVIKILRCPVFRQIMNCSKIKRLLKRFNLLPAKRKCRKKLRRESCVSYESHVDKEIQKLYESFSRRCISQDFISEMREAFSLFDKVII